MEKVGGAVFICQAKMTNAWPVAYKELQAGYRTMAASN